MPRGYVGEHVAYAYAGTADSAEGITVDHSLFAPSTASNAERAYIALSRGRESNRIYAATGSGWQEAIATDRNHTFAGSQHPDTHPTSGALDAHQLSHRRACTLPEAGRGSTAEPGTGSLSLHSRMGA